MACAALRSFRTASAGEAGIGAVHDPHACTRCRPDTPFLVQRQDILVTETFVGFTMPSAHTSLQRYVDFMTGQVRRPEHAYGPLPFVPMPLAAVRCMFQQVVLIINYTRCHGLHRDLDPSNLLLFFKTEPTGRRDMLAIGMSRFHKWTDSQVCLAASLQQISALCLEVMYL